MNTFPEIGERLRAYRLGSGLAMDEVASRLGISRAAVYRYEAGEVVKLDTLARLARLFGVSMTALLGVGIEYFSSGVTFFERLRQLEDKAHRVTVVFGPIAYVLTSDEYDLDLTAALSEEGRGGLSSTDISALLTNLRARKESYRRRRPTLINIVSVSEIERFLERGLGTNESIGADELLARRAAAAREIRRLATLLRQPRMEVQIGLTDRQLPTTGFQLIRQDARVLVVTSPFRVGNQPNLQDGIATISDAEEAVRIHEQVADSLWSSSLVGLAAAEEVEALLARSKSQQRQGRRHRR